MKKMLLAFITFLCFSLSSLAAVNINTASQADLETLDHVGPVKAKAIIDYRKKNGNFKTIDDLDKVDGIGPVTLKNIRKDIIISGAAATNPANSKAKQAAKIDDAKKITIPTKPVIAIKETKPAAKALAPSTTPAQKKFAEQATTKKNISTKSMTNKSVKVKTD